MRRSIAGHEDVIPHLIGSGIPVMGHLGLTPQSVNQLGGYRLQARSEAEAAQSRDHHMGEVLADTALRAHHVGNRRGHVGGAGQIGEIAADAPGQVAQGRHDGAAGGE